jgi:hypothetical protein
VSAAALGIGEDSEDENEMGQEEQGQDTRISADSTMRGLLLGL